MSKVKCEIYDTAFSNRLKRGWTKEEAILGKSTIP